MLLCSPLFFLFSLLPRNEASFQMLGVVPPERIKSEESCTQVRFVTNLFVLFDEFAVEVRPHTDVVKIDQRNAVVVGFVVAPPIAQIAKKKEYGEKHKRSQNMFEVEHFIGSCCLEVRTGFEPVMWVLPIRICNPSRSTAPSPDLIIVHSLSHVKHLFGGSGGTRTLTVFNRGILSPLRLPITPPSQILCCLLWWARWESNPHGISTNRF